MASQAPCKHDCNSRLIAGLQEGSLNSVSLLASWPCSNRNTWAAVERGSPGWTPPGWAELKGCYKSLVTLRHPLLPLMSQGGPSSLSFYTKGTMNMDECLRVRAPVIGRRPGSPVSRPSHSQCSLPASGIWWVTLLEISFSGEQTAAPQSQVICPGAHIQETAKPGPELKFISKTKAFWVMPKCTGISNDSHLQEVSYPDFLLGVSLWSNCVWVHQLRPAQLIVWGSSPEEQRNTIFFKRCKVSSLLLNHSLRSSFLFSHRISKGCSGWPWTHCITQASLQASIFQTLLGLAKQTTNKVTCCLVLRTSSEDCVIWQMCHRVNITIQRARPASHLTIWLDLSPAGGQAKVPAIRPGAVCSEQGQQSRSANPVLLSSEAIPTLALACQKARCCSRSASSLPHYSLASDHWVVPGS